MWVWMLLTLFTLVGEWHGRCYGCLEEERMGLLEIKSSIDPNGSSLIDWVDTSNESISNCCEWLRIECDNTTRRVIQLTLPGVRDERLGDLVLNASLFLPFKELRSLDLRSNAIVGCHENQDKAGGASHRTYMLESLWNKSYETGLLARKFNDAGSRFEAINIEETVEFTTKKRSEGYKGTVLNFMTGFDLVEI
ncbi:hypothetical protein DKX38_006876 [Salix brachista]|uniref:Leucine-rich repeat-containing N-terminal plant-type domain-containing protein n=1 Tax=Salix brachista TaxID=2182728 RepID=A0A5N5MLW3_9ROSI|nr:hypothetical protein DKX38_006876 [Salix brachista]